MTLFRFCAVPLIGFGLLLLVFLSLLPAPASLAQGGGQIAMTKTLNRATNVVRVGEVLTFTIALTNNSAFTLTNAAILDNYDNSVLAFAGATPPQNLHLPGSGVISWTNVAKPPIPPGRGVTVTVAFTVEHPKPATINFARAQDLVSSAGAVSQTAETSRTQEAIGGAAPVLKITAPLTATPTAGQPVTFTHLITNDGAALLTFLPLTDTYDPGFLQFHFASPTPSITTPPGRLVWTDLTTYFGPITPFATVVVTTVFTATTKVVNTVNQASTQGARDQYNNDLAPGLAQVPIIIIEEEPTPEPTENIDSRSDDDDDRDTVAAAPTPAATATPNIQATALAATATAMAGQTALTDTTAPLYLPETGGQSLGGYWGGLLLLVLFFGLLGYFYSQSRRGA